MMLGTARRSLRNKFNNSLGSSSSSSGDDTSQSFSTSVLSTRNLQPNLKRQVSDSGVRIVPQPKRRRVKKATPIKKELTTRVDGKLCPLSDVVNAVLSDSPMSKCSSIDDLEDDNDDVAKRDEVENVKKSLFDFEKNSKPKKVVTPKKKPAPQKNAVSDPPMSGGKFFKNRTPKKSKVLEAKSKSLILIRQTFGQKIKSASKDITKKTLKTKPKRRFNSLKFKNDCQVSKNDLPKENIPVENDVNDVDEPFAMSDENSEIGESSAYSPSESSLVSGPVGRLTRSRSTSACSSTMPSPILSEGLQKLAIAKLSADPSPALENHKTASPALSLRCQRLTSSLRTRSAGSSPSLSIRSKASTRNSADMFTSQNESDKSSSTTPKDSQTRINELLEGFMADGDAEDKTSPLKRKSPRKKREMELNDSPGWIFISLFRSLC